MELFVKFEQPHRQPNLKMKYFVFSFVVLVSVKFIDDVNGGRVRRQAVTPNPNTSKYIVRYQGNISIVVDRKQELHLI